MYFFQLITANYIESSQRYWVNSAWQRVCYTRLNDSYFVTTQLKNRRVRIGMLTAYVSPIKTAVSEAYYALIDSVKRPCKS